MLARDEIDCLLAACRRLPPAENDYRIDDFVCNLLLTVLDFQMQTVAVERAMAHFKGSRWDEVRSGEDLQLLFERFPDDQPGNTALAGYLWGYRLWTRARMLRDLTRYFATRSVRTQAELHEWARSSEFTRDFAGQVKGLGPAVYNWLVMRQGVETIKPDVHVMRFVARVLGRPTSPDQAVNTLKAVAGELGLERHRALDPGEARARGLRQS
jgi:hypothetical protein